MILRWGGNDVNEAPWYKTVINYFDSPKIRYLPGPVELAWRKTLDAMFRWGEGGTFEIELSQFAGFIKAPDLATALGYALTLHQAGCGEWTPLRDDGEPSTWAQPDGVTPPARRIRVHSGFVESEMERLNADRNRKRRTDVTPQAGPLLAAGTPPRRKSTVQYRRGEETREENGTASSSPPAPTTPPPKKPRVQKPPDPMIERLVIATLQPAKWCGESIRTLRKAKWDDAKIDGAITAHAKPGMRLDEWSRLAAGYQPAKPQPNLAATPASAPLPAGTVIPKTREEAEAVEALAKKKRDEDAARRTERMANLGSLTDKLTGKWTSEAAE